MMEVKTKLQIREQTKALTSIISKLRVIRVFLHEDNMKNFKRINLNSEIESLDDIIDKISIINEKLILIAMFGRYDDGSDR